MSQVEDIGIQKEENKLKMSIAMFIVFLVTIFIMYIIGRIDVEKIGVEKIEVLLPYFIFIPIVVPFGGALFVDKMLKKVDEKKKLIEIVGLTILMDQIKSKKSETVNLKKLNIEV